MIKKLHDTDYNECDENPCFENSECINFPGSYTCVCKLGYSDNGSSCISSCFLVNSTYISTLKAIFYVKL